MCRVEPLNYNTMKQTVTSVPQVHITNYQQYINTDYLTAEVLSNIPADAELPEHIYASIAYMRVVRFIGRYKTNLSLNIKGRTYSFTLLHDNDNAYHASKAVDLNAFGSGQEAKDIAIRVFQQAFEAVVNRNIKQITKAITTAYGS